MVYVFSEFNFFTILLTAFAACLLFLAMVGIYGFRVEKRKKSHPEDHEDFADRLDKRMNKQWAIISALFGLIAVSAMVKNIPNRTEALNKEVALVELTKNVEALTERRLGERCAFNGVTVDENWIETDTFPCATVGNVRIWAKGTTQVGRSIVTVSRQFVIGTVNDNGSIARQAEIDFESTEYGIKSDYPKTETSMKSEKIAALAQAMAR
jgi:hypothetical protein